jgi:NitT/TauT family transport system substrate-binding protein
MTSTKDEGLVKASRRRLVLSLPWAALAASGLGLGNAWAAPAKANASASPILKPEKRTIIIATTNPSALPYLPLLVAQHKGFFEQQGLELQISEQQSAARAIAAVSAGTADLVCGWLENMLSAAGRAMALQSFVLLGKAPMMAIGLSTRVATAAHSVSTAVALAQLRGRKVGVVALNSPTHTVAQAALRRAGLRPSDVGFVSVGSPASATAALRSGQIDALVHMDPLMMQLEQRSEIHLLADLRSPLSAYEAIGMHLPSSCVAAPQEFFQRLPGTAQACSDALVQALQWLAQASLRDVLHVQQSYPPSSPESAPALDAQSFVASYERLRLSYSSDGLCAPQSANDLLQAMHDVEPALRLEKIDAMRSVNNALAQRSLSRLKT